MIAKKMYEIVMFTHRHGLRYAFVNWDIDRLHIDVDYVAPTLRRKAKLQTIQDKAQFIVVHLVTPLWGFF